MKDEARKVLLEILAIAARTNSTASNAHNPSDAERLEMIARIAKRNT